MLILVTPELVEAMDACAGVRCMFMLRWPETTLELGFGFAEGYGEQRPVAKHYHVYLCHHFVFEGQPYQQVVDALVANSPDKTGEIVMVFERPLPS